MGRDREGVTIDIGCGEKPRGKIGVDVRPNTIVDVVADARELPFNPEVAAEVYMSDVIEHFRYSQVKGILVDVRIILEKGGILWVKTPDFRWIANNYDEIPVERFQRKVYGGWTYPLDPGEDYQENSHNLILTGDMLKELLEDAGFVQVQVNTDLPAPDHWNMAAHAIKPD